MDRSTVSHRLALHLLNCCDGLPLPLAAELRYDAYDPIAVTALFDSGAAEPVRWVFARDLLEAGMDQQSGVGDVVIWPARDSAGRPAVHIQLSSPHGVAHLEAPADEVEAFLTETWRIVGPGDENRHLDIDGALAELLGRR
jgi:hypothetical protein